MSYVDAWFDRDNDVIKVVERNKKVSASSAIFQLSTPFIIKTHAANSNQFTVTHFHVLYVVIPKNSVKSKPLIVVNNYSNQTSIQSLFV